MDLEQQLGCIGLPDLKHTAVNNIGQGALRVIGDGLAEYGIIVTAAPELTAPARERDQPSGFLKLLLHVGVPSSVGWEGGKVGRLKLFDKVALNLSLSGQCCRAAAIVSAVTNFLAHKSSIVMSIVGLFCNPSVFVRLVRPTYIGPDKLCNVSM